MSERSSGMSDDRLEAAAQAVLDEKCLPWDDCKRIAAAVLAAAEQIPATPPLCHACQHIGYWHTELVGSQMIGVPCAFDDCECTEYTAPPPDEIQEIP
jgi:hypothetical protein